MQVDVRGRCGVSFWAFPKERIDEVERVLSDNSIPAPQWFSRGPVIPRGPWLMGFEVKSEENTIWMMMKFGSENMLA